MRACMRASIRVSACVHASMCVCVCMCMCALLGVELMDITEQLAELHRQKYMKVMFSAEVQLLVLMSSG